MIEPAESTTSLATRTANLAKSMLKAGDFELAVTLYKKALILEATPAAEIPKKLYTWLVQRKADPDRAWQAAGLGAKTA